MRRFIEASLGGLAAVVLASCAVAAEPLDPSDPADALAIGRKIQCSTVDNQPIVYYWHGAAYGRRQGERDTHLFNVEGMNIRACSTISDPARGDGYHLVSRELLIYTDKTTGEALATWDNPWTGETVPVLHVANDPVNFKAYTRDPNGNTSAWSGETGGGQWWQRSTFPLWYPSPLGGDYQAEVGGTYHATELFNFFGRTEDLLDPETTTAKVTVGWSRMSDWLPWMKMNGREGIFWVHTAGRKLDSFDELSPVLLNEIATHYPEYNQTPPAGDPRPNMTSWKYFKAVREGTITPPQR